MYSSYSFAAALCSTIFPFLALLSILLRLRARFLQKQSLGADDYLILASLAFAFSYCCIVLYGSFRASIGQDLSTITPGEFSAYQKHLYVGVIVAHLSYGLSKLSVLQFYKRIFSMGRFKAAANLVMGVVVAFMVTATLVSNTFAVQILSNADVGAGPSFLRLAHIQLVDARKELHNQLWGVHHVVCGNRFGARCCDLVLAGAGDKAAAD
jgi:hypothetical protein